MTRLRRKELLQKEIIGMKSRIIKVIWAAVFIAGLIMILNKIQISRYVSDISGIFAAGIALSALSGLGLLPEMYGSKIGNIHDEEREKE